MNARDWWCAKLVSGNLLPGSIGWPSGVPLMVVYRVYAQEPGNDASKMLMCFMLSIPGYDTVQDLVECRRGFDALYGKQDWPCLG